MTTRPNPSARPGRFTPEARRDRLAAAAQALLELAAAREQATIEALGVVPFDHPSGKPRTTVGGCHLELLDACDDDDATLVTAPSFQVVL